MSSTQGKPKFELKASKRVEVVEYAVCLDDVQLGVVECAGGYSSHLNWYAHFVAGKGPEGGVLIQGHGPTPDDAIATAFIRTRHLHEKALVDIDELQAIMIPTGDEELQAEF